MIRRFAPHPFGAAGSAGVPSQLRCYGQTL